MKIALLSDLHIEFSKYNLKKELDNLVDKPDVVVLAGDSGLGCSSRNMIEPLLEDYKVIYLMGNHEGYSNLWELVVDRWNEFSDSNPNFYFLDKGNFFVINGVLFTGGTLWSDLSDPTDSAMAQYYMNDYRYINTIAGFHQGNMPISKPYSNENRDRAIAVVDLSDEFTWAKAAPAAPLYYLRGVGIHAPTLSAAVTTVWHRQTVAGIIDSINYAKENNYKVVCATHHTPHKECLNAAHSGNCLDKAYYTDLSHIMPDVNTWLCGHTHNRMDKVINGCRVVMNCRGYVRGNESEIRTPFSIKVVEV
jgi:predicted phosphodiesterase